MSSNNESTTEVKNMNPPAAIQNAMGRNRKPFTYTPGGLDLSEIKSERMAARLMRNAMNEGVPEKPISAVQTPTTPTTLIAVPNYNCLPVQVFPTFSLPANPKSLLRTRSTPGQSRELPLERKVSSLKQSDSNVSSNGCSQVRNNYAKLSDTVNNSNVANVPSSVYSTVPIQNNISEKSYDDYRKSVLLTPSYEANYYQTVPTLDISSIENTPKQNINNVPRYSSLNPELCLSENKPFVNYQQSTIDAQNFNYDANPQLLNKFDENITPLNTLSRKNISSPKVVNEENKLNPYGITNYGFDDNTIKLSNESELITPKIEYGTLAYAKKEITSNVDEFICKYQREEMEPFENLETKNAYKEIINAPTNSMSSNDTTLISEVKKENDDNENNNMTNIKIKPLSDPKLNLVSTKNLSPDVNENLDEQTEVKVVKKVKKEKKVEETNNQTENGDGGADAALTVKLPSKKSAAKTETKVEVLTKTLPDGSMEETKKTITKTTIDGKTEIKTKIETKTIPKECDEDEEIEEEEEAEDVVEENGVDVEELVEEPVTTVIIKQAPKIEENGQTVVKEEKSETTTTRKVLVEQNDPKDESEEEEEEEIEETEKIQNDIKQESLVEKTSEAELSELAKQEVEEAEEEEEDVEEQIEKEQKENLSVVKTEQAAEIGMESNKHEDEEQIRENVEEAEIVVEKSVETVKVQENEESEYTEEEYESETEEATKPAEAPEPKQDPKEKEPPIEETPKKDEVQETPKQEKSEPAPLPETAVEPPKPLPREIPIHLDVVEDIEIKPIGPASESISKSHTESTEIIRNKDSLGGPISTQTELHRVENIVVSNRITKSLDNSYDQMIQGLPTVKTYFAPSRERVETSPLPAKPYQPSYNPEPTTERRHSLLLERLSMERQIPPPLQQYQNTYQTYNNQSYESQRDVSQEPRVEVVNVANVKPSSITNQQWYQQSNKENVIYNNTATSQSWSQSQDQPQYHQQYQPPTKQQYQAPPQPQYQVPVQPQYQTPAQPQYQSPAQPQYQAPAQPQYHSSAQPQYQAPAQPQYQAPTQPQYQAPAQPQYQSQPSYNDNYSQNYSKNTTTTYKENNYSSYTPKPTSWASTLDSVPIINEPTNQYSYQNTDSFQNNQNTQKLSSTYVPPPWEQDPNYVAPQNTSTIYYKPASLPTNTDFKPTLTPGWKPTPAVSKFSKPTSTAYVPPAPNQSFVKPAIPEPPKVAGCKTYYSEYERRYISVPESTYVPGETKYQPSSNPSPQYYQDNEEQTEKSEHTWRKELREFTEKKTQNEYQTQQSSVNPPWEETSYAKTPNVSYTPTPSWSQTLKPGSGRERSFESEFVSQERSKFNTLGRNRPVSYIHNSVESPLPDRARGVSVDRYNPNAYHSPIPSEHSPVQVKTLTPETAPAKNFHNPHVPAYHNRASAEPREQSAAQYHKPRGYNDRAISPVQSRSFKYLQWITGTENEH